MTGAVALARRLLAGLIELGRIVVFELVLGGDPLTAVAAVLGTVFFAVAFGVGGYALVGGVVAAVGRP